MNHGLSLLNIKLVLVGIHMSSIVYCLWWNMKCGVWILTVHLNTLFFSYKCPQATFTQGVNNFVVDFIISLLDLIIKWNQMMIWTSYFLYMFSCREAWCSVCSGSVGWGDGAERNAVPPHWHWDFHHPNPQEYYRVVSTQRCTLLVIH